MKYCPPGWHEISGEYRKIQSIIPAEGWFARYSDKDPGARILAPLVCWALCLCIETGDEEEEPHSYVYGMETGDGLIDFCDSASNFVGYIHSRDVEDPQDGMG